MTIHPPKHAFSMITCCFLLFFAHYAVAQNAYETQGPNRLEGLNNNVDMTCFPPPNPGGEPGIGPAPPCLLPTDLDPSVVAPNPSGLLNLKYLGNGDIKITIDLDGLDENMVVTAWTSYFFPGGPVAPHPIFDPIGPGLPPIAGVSAPMTPTTAAFTEGLAPEPNQFNIKSNGSAKLTISLDYDPLLPGQGPLRNGMVTTNQGVAPAGDDAEQPLCCPAGVPAPSYQPVGSSFLRAFDPATGFQRLDANGWPILIRSPRAVDFIAIVVHTDKTTHGINPGIPILPIPGLSATTGDHYLLGIFDLRALHPSNGNQPAQFVPSKALADEGYELSGVYPNPFNPITSFQLRVAETQHVKIDVYDMLGRFVANVHDGELTQGQGHLFSFDAASLASGKYLLRATGEKFISNQNITLLK